MKKIGFIISFAVVFSCNSNTETQGAYESNSNQAPVTEYRQQAITGAETRLTNGIPELNNGEKWQADDSTNANVAALKSTVTEFKQIPKPTEEDYITFHESFTAGLNKMIQQCKMKGPHHDALHVWLEPLLKDNKDLAVADSKNERERLVQQINDRLAIYPKYFN